MIQTLKNLKVYCEFEKFFQTKVKAALCKANIEQMYKECKNRTNNYII